MSSGGISREGRILQVGRGNRPRKRLERVCENVGFFRGLKAAEHGWGTETVRDERLGSCREGRARLQRFS